MRMGWKRDRQVNKYLKTTIIIDKLVGIDITFHIHVYMYSLFINLWLI